MQPLAAAPPKRRPNLFISYAREDIHWVDSIERALAILTKQSRLDVFIDRQIRTGEEWKPRIFRAIEDASPDHASGVRNFALAVA
jgi:hypothetical protein